MIRDDLSIDDAGLDQEDPAPHRTWLRFLPAGIALGAIALFGGVVGYTYMSRSSGSDGPVPLVRADARPAKVKPDSPGGMEVPHQDKEIYARMAQPGAAPPPPSPKVERLLPPPEAPLPKPVLTPAPPPPVAAIPTAPDVKPPANAVVVQPPAVAAPAPMPAPPPAVASVKPPEARPVEPPKAAAEAKPTEPPKAAAKPAPEPKQLANIAPAAGAPVAGAYRVQIASLRTTEDATKSWEKLKSANPDLLGKLSGNVVRADLGAKGTFYRVVAGAFSDREAANDLCAKLKQRNVGCLVVKP